MGACKMMDENILIENAILAFLHHYPNHKWAVSYAEILTLLRNEQLTLIKKQKRGRPAKRQRKKETPTDTTSKEKN